MRESVRNELLAAVYDGIFDQERWHDGISIAAEAVAAETVTYWLRDQQRNCVECIGALGMEGLNLREYEEYYHTKDLWSLAAQKQPNKMWLLDHIVPQRDLERSEIRNEYGNPAGVDIYWGMGGFFELGPAGALAFGFHRGARRANWSREDYRVGQWLSSHIQRSARTLLQLQPIRDGLSRLSRTFDHLTDAILIITSSGRILYQNAAAERMLSNGKLLRGRGGRLAAFTPDDTDRLSQAAATATGALDGGPGTVARTYILGADATTPMILTCTPFRNHLPAGLSETQTILVTASAPRNLDDATRVAVVGKRYALSPAETKLTARLMAGETLPQACGALGISFHTGRSQIKTIFQKVGVHSQVELLSALLK